MTAGKTAGFAMLAARWLREQMRGSIVIRISRSPEAALFFCRAAAFCHQRRRLCRRFFNVVQTRSPGQASWDWRYCSLRAAGRCTPFTGRPTRRAFLFPSLNPFRSATNITLAVSALTVATATRLSRTPHSRECLLPRPACPVTRNSGPMRHCSRQFVKVSRAINRYAGHAFTIYRISFSLTTAST
jgi:hypothetical protein